MIKLCYKEYPFKMSLGAMKQFKQATGEDLWFTLLSFIESYNDTVGMTTIQRLNSLYAVCDFEVGANLLHSLIYSENKNVPLCEIEDSMFRVGWLPNGLDDDLSDPWPLVVVSVAHEINNQFSEVKEVKKSGISERAGQS